MKRLRFGIACNRQAFSSTLALTLGLILGATCAKGADNSPDNATPAGAPEIECTTPDGRTELVRPDARASDSAAVLNAESLSCALQQGRTTFVIKMPSAALLDRFTFVNENGAAAGELKISVSDCQLPAASPKWVEVDGNITFSRKRRFNLSMLGVEAHYVKLTFKVDSTPRLAAAGL